jgi:hypothetical protein
MAMMMRPLGRERTHTHQIKTQFSLVGGEIYALSLFSFICAPPVHAAHDFSLFFYISGHGQTKEKLFPIHFVCVCRMNSEK